VAREEFDSEGGEPTNEPPRLTITSCAWRACPRFLSGIRPKDTEPTNELPRLTCISYLFVFSYFLIPSRYPTFLSGIRPKGIEPTNELPCL